MMHGQKNINPQHCSYFSAVENIKTGKVLNLE